MSPTLAVEHHPGSIERARADVAVVPLFESERPLRESAGCADWRLCGQLSRLLQEGRISGALGEAVLVPTFGGLRAPVLLALGLGPRRGFPASDCEAFAAEAVHRSVLLRAESAAIALPLAEVLLRERLEALVRGAAAALAAAPQPMPDVLRVLVVAQHEESVRAASVLSALRPKGLPPAVALRLAPLPRESKMSPAGTTRRPVPRAAPSVK